MGNNCAIAQFHPESSPQLELLPIDAAPTVVRRHGLRAAHTAPLVGRRTGPGKTFWSGRVPASHAWAYEYVAMADAGATWAAIVLDCDNRFAMGAGLSDLPPPNWLVQTRRGAHVTWCLADPVGKHRFARVAPEQYLAHVNEYFSEAVSADPAFGGMGRNPTYKDAKTVWGAKEPYSLDALASVIPFGWKRPKIASTGIGRNVDLFRTGLRWAGRDENADLAILPALHAVNAKIGKAHGRPPLGDREVGSIARSIERYRERWVRNGWHCPTWIARQSARGKLGGRPRKYEPGKEPWTLEGIHRRTWERRAAKANTVNARYERGS